MGLLAAVGPAFAATGKVYVADEESSTVSVIDAASFKKIGSIAVGLGPHNVQVAPDGKTVWVTNNGEPGNAAAPMPSASGPAGTPGSMRKSEPKGEHESMAGAGAVLTIDTATDAVVQGPAQVGFTPDGRLGLVSLSKEDRVAVIDPASRKVLHKVAVGTVPIQLVATPDSRLLLVANQGTREKPGKTVSIIDLDSFKSVATIETGPGAHGGVIDREGRRAFVTNTYANTVSVLDIALRKVIGTVPVGRGPNGISATP